MSVNIMETLQGQRPAALLLSGALAICIVGGLVRAAESPTPVHRPAAKAPPPAAPAAGQTAFFKQYCFGCHGNTKGSVPGGISLTHMTENPVGDSFNSWQKVETVLNERRMPPKGMPQPTDEQRHAASSWVHTELATFANKNAGDPGRVTVRRLTSGEYGYTVQDLTGLDLDFGRDFANDSVGGEGFMNFGDVQFMQDASLERYLEAAKSVADHAVIGAGPVEFFEHPGKTGFELSAITRIKDIYATYGFRTVSGEGGDSFGLDKYRKAFYAAWRYQHRAALGQPNATLKTIAAEEGASARFAQHILTIVAKPSLGYPMSEVAARWRKLPNPSGDPKAAEAEARRGAEDLEKYVTTWPSWLFARGDKAVGGAGDESPLIFDDASLKAEPSHHFVYNMVGRNPVRGRAMGPGPVKVVLNVAAITADSSVKPLVIWRNPTIMVRKGPPPRPAQVAADAAAAKPVAAPAKPAQAAAAQPSARGRGQAGPKIPLREFVSPEMAQKLHFGVSPDGTEIGPNDFVTEGTASFEVQAPAGAFGLAFEADASIGKDRQHVIRISFSDREDGPPRGIPVHALIGDPQSSGYHAFKAGVLELVDMLPPNSNGEPTPADKDPPPAPFDPTYNTPEHDAFDNNVKYHRDDRFVYNYMLDDATRVKLDRAWTDLYSSFPYHDNYLVMLADKLNYKLKSKKMADLTAAEVEAMPAELRKYVKPLRSEYLETVSAEAAGRSGHIEDCLKFASRAWRRPLTEQEKESLRAFYRQTLLSEHDHTKAVRAVLTRILVSPSFLYRIEEPVATAAARPLSDWELADRLSYFLWSSIPDDELRRAAAAGELKDPQQLRRQVKRMMADPKARRLSAEFFGQWLGFYRFDQYRGVDTSRYPEFTDAVRSAMYDEAVSYFEYIIRHDRPASEILYSDYTFMNKTLARYYGVSKDITSDETVKVDGAGAYNRGGLLRLGAVLTSTSAPLRTSPVKRGDWVLRRILGTPTPPPPPDAGSIPADDKLFGGLSLHDKLEAHKRNATCATCHSRIDPLGFPLEHYDSTGRWRDKYADGKEVYDKGTTLDRFDIEGAQGLLSYLKTKDDLVRRTFAMKLLGYAFGRTILPSDLPLIDRMIGAGPDAPLSGLISEVVVSRQFRNHLGKENAPAGQPAKAAPVKMASAAIKNSEKAGTR